MAGLAKGLAIIEIFARSPGKLTVSEAARATGITPAAANRCLLTLNEIGYVSYDGKFFRPTPRMLLLGMAYLESAELPALAQPQLQAARDELDEAVSLVVLEEEWAVFVARAEARRIVAAGVRLGARLPAYASSTGRVLLAALPDDELDALLARIVPTATTPNTLVDIAEIRERIVQARTDDLSDTDEELAMGMRTLAVPVRNSHGHTVAAMSVSLFTARMTREEMLEQCLPVLRDHAAQLGRML
jgi:IclR family pca regulon transcriptional regulator